MGCWEDGEDVGKMVKSLQSPSIHTAQAVYVLFDTRSSSTLFTTPVIATRLAHPSLKQQDRH